MCARGDGILRNQICVKTLSLSALIVAAYFLLIGCAQISAPISEPTITSPVTLTPSQNVSARQADIRLTISLDTVYYMVSGETTEEIFNSVEANGPDIGALTKGRIASGLTKVESSYKTEFSDYGTYCEFQSADINMRLVVTLPQHSTPQALGDLQLSRWNDFVEGVAIHEQKHVDIYNDGMEAFKKRLESFPEKWPDCDSLDSSLALAWESERTLTEQEQDAFHLAEEQRSQHLRNPLRTQIDQGKSELEELQYKLDSLSLEIDAHRLEIDDIERLAQPYEDQMNAIKDQYPDLVLPPDVFDEYELLLAEWNRLNDQRNGVVTQLNALVGRHKQTADEYNRLAEQINQLNEELAWLP